KLIHINVEHVTSVRSDTQIPGARAQLDLTSGKFQGVQETIDEIMALISPAPGARENGEADAVLRSAEAVGWAKGANAPVPEPRRPARRCPRVYVHRRVGRIVRKRREATSRQRFCPPYISPSYANEPGINIAFPRSTLRRRRTPPLPRNRWRGTHED